VTAADVARSLGLSRATVGFVLNDTPGQTISEPTRQRVLAEAERLGYRPHTAARALASGRSHIVLLLLPDWPVDHAMRTHLDEAALVLDRAGYSMVTMTPHPGGQAVPLWESLAPDVVISLTPIPDEQYDAVKRTGALTLVPGRDSPGLETELHVSEGPWLQVSHLVGSGRKRIVFAGSTDPRLADLVEQRAIAAEARKIDLTGTPLIERVDVDERVASRVVSHWVAGGVDGVVAYNDEIAALVLGAAIRQGVAVPADLAIVGHDDSPLAALLVPSLTSVGIDTAGLGRFLADLVLAQLAGQPEPVAGPEGQARLMLRESA
jgi:DNA-binding LacI/PurR family transcriptional regulator